jgi:hypothetical protein
MIISSDFMSGVSADGAVFETSETTSVLSGAGVSGAASFTAPAPQPVNGKSKNSAIIFFINTAPYHLSSFSLSAFSLSVANSTNINYMKKNKKINRYYKDNIL